ncbi:bifunctional 3,4-dihydroxy-2-butanone-4-phosphate synthase/GTP cyclohydrolase II [Corynebacterium sp. 13CS0277]|uniref:bifunctional 3,4-dihydroxy-2-butanone-4-phosphate synthase/GTP cyclohydrolase II n=1 Tax=Corynebacterium sp. 13CS0277 TaxID=2071994 RepID=UPI000D0402C5|nr:bifunctional 3,4-dihydroxy-2-butanone-4-phosphate synthase/GTP cyclohydrolase II [Corynebacterium sp. 13CS0277]PRQ11992.1 bifunctional 3,4-dihydroxy-2-butanone-4-phosphate synthase/GTP cyclohydrolase II [Corynebacterium sp. 13CS0277]
MRLDSIERAIADIRAGRPVVVVDDEDRENEGDLIFAAETVTPELMAFLVRHTSGYVCVSLEGEACDRLHLPPMVARNEDARNTAYTVTVDANTGTTGISAASRAETVRRLADPHSTPGDFTRPGHVVPLRAVPGGVLRRAGHTEAAVDLARLAGLAPVGVLCEVVGINDPTDMARGEELRAFCDEHDLALVSIAQLIAYRRRTETLVERVTETRLPTDFGEFTAVGYRAHDGVEHVALVVGDISSNNGEDVLVRVHSECLTGDVFASRRCDCGQQLHASMELVQQQGRGVVLYMRGHEGRGIGLLAKLQAYALQDSGHDTVDANLALGLPADARDFGTGAQILVDLGIRSINLISNNPTKRAGLTGYGLEIAQRTAIPIDVHEDNIAYLRTKRDRMGHELPNLD